nr:Arm DNA-binding domain-containing protein [Lactovum miscens]
MVSFQKLKTSWEVRVPYKTEDGKYKQRVRKDFRTKKKAEQAAIRLQLGIEHPEKLAKNQTLREFVEN